MMKIHSSFLIIKMINNKYNSIYSNKDAKHQKIIIIIINNKIKCNKTSCFKKIKLRIIIKIKLILAKYKEN